MASTTVNNMSDVNMTDVNFLIANLTARLDELNGAYNSLQGNVAIAQRSMTDFYLCIFSMLTFIIQIGFLFMTLGLVRTKSATNILLKGTIDGFVGACIFFVFGWGFAWGDGNAFIGWTQFALSWIPTDQLSNALYQMVYANTASTIVCGAVSERLNLPSYFVYGTILTGFAYPIQSRWGFYHTGWLRVMGMHDYAGSGLVHLFAGTCAVTACAAIGPRIGRFDGTKEGLKPISGHSLPLVGLGVLILVFGFMGFNAVGQLSITQAEDALILTSSAMNTLLSASTGSITALFVNRFLPHRGHYWSFITMCNGVVAGCAASCAGCDKMSPWGGFVTGIFAGLFYIILRELEEKLKLDDPIEAFPIHFGGGLAGMLTAPFLIYDGILINQDTHSAVVLGANILGCLVIVAWALLWSLPMFFGLKYLGLLRVSAELEESGMDVIKHNEICYPREAWSDDFFRPSGQINNHQHPVAVSDCGLTHCCSRDSMTGDKILYPPLSPDNLGRRRNNIAMASLASPT